jgi:polyvinyl alcohol dehydrogenase (cytochrome)
MKRAALIVLGLGLLSAPAALADAKSGGDMFDSRCALCHSAGVGGAPPTEKLKGDTPESILEKLTTGTMAPMAAGISDAEKRDIAVFLSGKGLPASGDLPAVDPLPVGDAAPAAPAADAAPAATTPPSR